jgi:hypothetical protein
LFRCRFAARSGAFFEAINGLLDAPHMTKNLIDHLSQLINHLQCSAFVTHGVFP